MSECMNVSVSEFVSEADIHYLRVEMSSAEFAFFTFLQVEICCKLE